MVGNSGQQDRNLEITFALSGPNEGHRFTLRIPTYNLWLLYQALDKARLDGSLAIAKTAGIIATLLKHQGLPDADFALNTVWFGLADLLNVDLEDVLEDDEPADEEQVLNFCYVLLKHKRITREEAARIATALLKRPHDKDAWRKKLDRWVERKGYTALGQTKRPPRRDLSGRKTPKSGQ